MTHTPIALGIEAIILGTLEVQVCGICDYGLQSSGKQCSPDLLAQLFAVGPDMQALRPRPGYCRGLDKYYSDIIPYS